MTTQYRAACLEPSSARTSGFTVEDPSCSSLDERVLLTPRLRMRPVTVHDARAVHRITGNPQVMEHYVDLPVGRDAWTSAQTADFTAACAASWTAHGFGYWAVEVAGQVVGYCGLYHLDYLPVAPSTVELSCRLHPAWWGAGLAAEASFAAVSYGFTRIPGLGSIALAIATTNSRSRRAAQKLGMTVDRCYPYLSPISGRAADFAVYRISRTHWMQQAAGLPGIVTTGDNR